MGLGHWKHKTTPQTWKLPDESGLLGAYALKHFLCYWVWPVASHAPSIPTLTSQSLLSQQS